jgi:polyferredoxin
MSARKFLNYRVIRWLIQLSLLAVFVLLFALTRLGARVQYLDAFFRLDPLILLVTSLAARTLVAASLLALVFIAATLVFGRFFCGFVCPLGTVIDLFDSAIRAKPRPGSWLSQGKYLALLFLLIAAMLHGSWLGIFDPLVIAGRSLALLLYPAAAFLHARFVPARPVVFKETWIALGILLAILGTGFVAPRFWCRNLCPLGGLYALFSRFSLLKFSFARECRNCGL